MVEGGMKCIKFLLFSFNFIFVIVGIGLIAAGAVVITAFKEYTTFLGDGYYGPSVFLCVVGVIIFAIASFGCCGAYKENYHCVMAFAVLLGVIFVLEIAAGIAGFVKRDDIQDFAVDTMLKSEPDYGKNSAVTEAWDKVQQEYSCCGVLNSSEWTNILNNTLPDSCCVTDKVDCGKDPTSKFFQENCKDSFIASMKNNILTIGGVGIGLAFVQLVGILFACCLGRAIRKEYEVV